MPSEEPIGRSELIDRFASFPDRLADAARAADARLALIGGWTPELVVRHLIAVEGEVWRARLAELAAGGEPRWSWVEPGPALAFPGASLDEVLDVLADLRAGTVGLLGVFDLDALGWDRAGVHATFGRLDVAGLLRLAIDHDEEHRRGLTEAPARSRRSD